MREISNSDDFFDSRDVIERISELEELESDEDYELAEWEAEELAALRALATEGESATDEWPHGVTLIRDGYFEDYAIEFAKDIGAISGDESWPATCIDWKQAADELQMNYTSVDFGGETYWLR